MGLAFRSEEVAPPWNRRSFLASASPVCTRGLELITTNRDEYPIHTRRDQIPELTEEKVKTTFLVDAKGVSKSLIKAIIKPTVSHIADAHRKREVRAPAGLNSSGIYLSIHPGLTRLLIVVQNQNDVPVPTGSKAEQHKTRTETAMKVARNVGFGSAVTCGKIAMLPFKSKSLSCSLVSFFANCDIRHLVSIY